MPGHVAGREEQGRAVKHGLGGQHPVVMSVRRAKEAQLRERRVRFADVDELVLPGFPHLVELVEALELPGAGQKGGA